MLRIALVSGLVACSGSARPANPTPAPAPAPAPVPGSACGAGDACPEPMQCVKYSGIAGASGPQFATCEIKCLKESCPTGMHCATIADGPGAVCRT
jgi:hypothetical protein